MIFKNGKVIILGEEMGENWGFGFGDGGELVGRDHLW